MSEVFDRIRDEIANLLPLFAGLEESYTRRLARLDQDARRLLLVTAADPTGARVRLDAGGEIIAGGVPAAQIIGRADIDVAVAQFEEIDIPHRCSLPTLLRSFGRYPTPRGA